MPAGNEELKQAMGSWLTDLAPWDAFSTWTFSRLVRVNGALYWARRHVAFLEKLAAQPVHAFLAVESGDRGGLLHVHGLVGNVGHLKAKCAAPGKDLVKPKRCCYGRVHCTPGDWGCPCCMLHAWPCGFARVYPYDPERGAAHYVGKYITKRLAEWELVGFPCTPQKVLDSVRSDGAR